jgi:predicted Zn-dependent protease
MIERRRHVVSGLCGCAAWTWLAARTAMAQGASDFVAPGYRPAPETDERGLWGLVERAERDLASSRFVVRDPALRAYIGDVACRLSKPHCGDVRTYVVRTPHFNASMAPNGMLQVWTGMLLRCHDEAQLAAIVGHELGHYLRRHSVERFRDARAKADFAAFLNLGLAAAGVGVVGALTNLALLASTFAYTRDQEREADEIGLRLMKDAGYVPAAAAEVWSQLIDELQASTADRNDDVFFASHPKPEERLGTMRERAGDTPGERFRERYAKGIAGIRPMLLRDEVRLRQYGRSDKVLDRILVLAPGDADAWFAKGEVARLRAGDGDGERARDAYRKAIATGRAPAEAWRSLGQVDLAAGRTDDARRAFEAYFEARPDAPDRATIRALLP